MGSAGAPHKELCHEHCALREIISCLCSQEEHWALRHEAMAAAYAYMKSTASGDVLAVVPRAVHDPGAPPMGVRETTPIFLLLTPAATCTAGFPTSGVLHQCQMIISTAPESLCPWHSQEVPQHALPEMLLGADGDYGEQGSPFVQLLKQYMARAPAPLADASPDGACTSAAGDALAREARRAGAQVCVHV